MNKFKDNWKSMILILPFALVILLLFLSIFQVLLQSLGYLPAFGMDQLTLDYYSAVFNRPDFLSSLLVSVRVSFISSVLACILGVLLVASLVKLNKKKPSLHHTMRLPILVPHAVVALFCILIVSQTGILARILYGLGLIEDHTQFPSILYTEGYWGVILSYLWKEIPFVAYFCYALMRSINSTLSEASENLGASSLRSFLEIELPLSLPAILKSFLIILIFNFGGYEIPLLLGPTLPKALPIQAHHAYYHPDLTQRPYAMALFGIILLFSAFMSLLYYLLMRFIIKRTGGES